MIAGGSMRSFECTVNPTLQWRKASERVKVELYWYLSIRAILVLLVFAFD